MESQWLQSGRMLWYVHGNIHKDVAKSIVEQGISELGLSSTPKEQLSSVRQIDLSSDSAHF
jgi:hypothetical protein